MTKQQTNARLSREEEIALARVMQRGDEKAKEALIISSVSQVELLASWLSGGDAELHKELTAEGYLKLTKKVPDFDPARGSRLTTFLQPYLIGEMIRTRKKYSEDHSHKVSLDAMPEEGVDPSYPLGETRRGEVKDKDALWDLLRISTPAEEKAVRLFAEGLSDRAIGREMGVGRKKTKQLRESGLKKLRFYCKTEGISEGDFYHPRS